MNQLITQQQASVSLDVPLMTEVVANVTAEVTHAAFVQKPKRKKVSKRTLGKTASRNGYVSAIAQQSTQYNTAQAYAEIGRRRAQTRAKRRAKAAAMIQAKWVQAEFVQASIEKHAQVQTGSSSLHRNAQAQFQEQAPTRRRDTATVALVQRRVGTMNANVNCNQHTWGSPSTNQTNQTNWRDALTLAPMEDGFSQAPVASPHASEQAACSLSLASSGGMTLPLVAEGPRGVFYAQAKSRPASAITAKASARAVKPKRRDIPKQFIYLGIFALTGVAVIWQEIQFGYVGKIVAQAQAQGWLGLLS